MEFLKHLKRSFQPYQPVAVDCCKQFILIEFQGFVDKILIQAAKIGENQAEVLMLTSKLTQVFIWGAGWHVLTDFFSSFSDSLVKHRSHPPELQMQK